MTFAWRQTQTGVISLISFVVFFVSAVTALAAQEPDPKRVQKPVDLQKWSQQGYPENGSWEVSADGKSVVQTINRSPTFFVSPEPYVDTVIEGAFKVETSHDDDYIGFVLGLQSPISGNGDPPSEFDFLLFDWKQASQGEAQEGFSLCRVKGEFDYRGGGDGGHYVPGFWNHAPGETFDIVAKDFGSGKGWKDNTTHKFKLVYRPDSIRIYIDGEKVFDVDGDYASGRFGFYNYSQANVRYSNFARTVLAVRAKAGDTIVSLAWRPPMNSNVRGYRIYRNGRSEPLAEVAESHFQDIGLSNGRRYMYEVRAVTEDEHEWKGYEAVTLTPHAG